MGDDNLLLPMVGDHLVLHMPCCGDEPHDSRLGARRADDLLVAAPTEHPHQAPDEPYPAGSPVLLGWPVAPNGWAELATTFVVDAAAGDRVWRVARTGKSHVVQRRDFARVTHLVPMRVCIAATWFPSVMVDLSEGGLACALVARPPGLDAGVPVQSELTVGTDGVVLPGHAVRVDPMPNGEVILHVCFEDLSSRMSDQIRKDVFALQIRQRARGAA